MRRPAILLLALPLLGACALTSTGTDVRRRVMEDLNREEVLWKAKDVHSYDFDFQRDCSGCSVAGTQPVNIHVRDDRIVQVVDDQGVAVVPQSGISWPTVDSLFVWSRQFLENKSFAVGLAFDTTYHFPNFIHGEGPGFVVEHHSDGLIEQTPTAPTRVSGSGEGYLIAAPPSKSKSVSWRSR